MKKDIIVSAIIIAASVYFFILTLQIESVAGYERMGPAFWPRFNLIGMVILAGIIIVRSLIQSGSNKTTDTETEKDLDRTAPKWNPRYVLACAGILVCFILAIPYLGFLLTAFLAVAGLIYFLGEKKIWVAFLVSFGMIASIYLLFGKLMYVPMPRGVWLFQELSNLLY